MNNKNIFSLKNKRVLVIGGTGYLGQYFVDGFLAHDANVVLIDLPERAPEKKATAFSNLYKGECVGYSGDITDPNSITKCAQSIKDDFSGIDVLINSTQANDSIRNFETSTIKDWHQTTKVNSDGTFLSTQIFGNLILDNPSGGSIILVSSIYGIVGPDNRIYEGSSVEGEPMGTAAAYSFTKAGIIGFTKYLATYWAQKNIRVNSITPGGIEAEQSSIFKNNYNKRVPMGRMGTPEDVVGAAIFLASDASSYMTGQNLVIDGGFTVW